MENETQLTFSEVNHAVQLWDTARQSYSTVKNYLYPNQAFRLTYSEYSNFLESSTEDTVHAYLGIKDEKLILIWVPVEYDPSEGTDEDLFTYSSLSELSNPSYLVNTVVEVKTHVIELDSELAFSSSNSYSEKNYIGSDNAVPSNVAFARINSWTQSCYDWAYRVCLNSLEDSEIVRVFSVPMNDLKGLFIEPEAPGVNMIKIFMGLYFSSVAGFEVPDLILAGDRTGPTGIIELPGTKKYNEATDLIRPCPPFCNDISFAF